MTSIQIIMKNGEVKEFPHVGRAVRYKAIKSWTDKSSGFDYDLQVWVLDGVVQACFHPMSMREDGHCCNSDRYKGMAIKEAIRQFRHDANSKSSLIG